MDGSRTRERAGRLYKQNLGTRNEDWPEGGTRNGRGRATTLTWTKQTNRKTDYSNVLTAPQDKCDQRTENNVSVGTRRRGGKGKAIPLQAWTGPEGSRRLRLPDFKTIGT